MKRILSFVLSVMMMLTMVFAVDLSAYADEYQVLPVNSSVSFNSTELDGRKNLSVTLPSTGKITLSLSSSQFSRNSDYADIYIGMEEPIQNHFYSKKFEYNSQLGYFNNSSVTFSLMQGTYYFAIDDLLSSKSVDYILTCSFTPSAESFPESLYGQEQKFLSDAFSINTDVIYNGQMSDLNDYKDIYAVHLNRGKMWITFATESGTYAEYGVYDSNGNYIDNKYGYTYDDVWYEIPTEGTYYIQVYGRDAWSGWGDYSFLVTQTDYSKIYDRVTGFKASSRKKNSIKLSWNKKSGASGYEVQKYNGKKWITYKTVGANTNSVTVTKLKAFAEYRFRVRPYAIINGERINGDFTKALKTSTTSDMVTKIKLGLTVNNRKKKAYQTVSWKAQKGVSGYQIQFGEDERGYGGKGVTWYRKIIVKGASKKSYRFNVAYASGDAVTAVRIRPYKTVNRKKIYGAWSKTAYLHK